MTRKILVIDDQKPIYEVFVMAAKDAPDCRVDWASTGTKGLERLAEARYDLLFLDLNLGSAPDGIETLKHIRGGGHDLPIYVITGFYDKYAETLKRMAVEDGVVFEVLRKPVLMDTIREIINSVPHPVKRGDL